jgi:uncharacterized membrane protein YphA (DoxX/SURF4 family)
LDTIKKAISILTVLFLSVGFLGVGMVKLVDHPETIASFAKWGFPSWFMYVVGVFEILLAIALFYKPSRKIAILLTLLHMVVALTIHILFKESDQLYGPILVITLAIFLFFAEFKF